MAWRFRDRRTTGDVHAILCKLLLFGRERDTFQTLTGLEGRHPSPAL